MISKDEQAPYSYLRNLVAPPDDHDLILAISELRAVLPGCSFSVGECSVSCDASVCPPHGNYLDHDLNHPSTMAEALRGAARDALQWIAEARSKADGALAAGSAARENVERPHDAVPTSGAMLSRADEDLEYALGELRQKLPGWWFSVYEDADTYCFARVGPDAAYQPLHILHAFGEGIESTRQTTIAAALRSAAEEVSRAISEYWQRKRD